MDKNLKKQFAAHHSNALVTLQQGQGHQTWYELVDHKQSYDLAKFERSPLNSHLLNNNIKVFIKLGNISIISPEYIQKSKIVVCS